MSDVEHVALHWRIRAGRVDDYDRRHAAMWPELEARLRELGVVDISIFRRDRDCFGHFQVVGWRAHQAAYEQDPLAQRWERELAALIEPELTQLTYVWTLGDRPDETNPEERI